MPCATCAAPGVTSSRRLQKDGELSTDELERVEKDLEKITHEQVALIDQLLAQKERELLQV